MVALKRKIISLLFLCLTVSGCSGEQTNVSSPITSIEEPKETTAPEVKEALSVEGLEITYEDGGVYVYIPADYADENIGEYFRETEGVIYVPDEESMFRVENGALYNKDMTVLYAVPAECEDTVPEGGELPKQKVFTVPESVTYIAPNAFYIITTSRPLITLYLPDGVTEENQRELVLWGGTFVHRVSDK